MELNLEGVVVGAASLLVIGAFHPLVIWCEYRFTQRIWPVFLIVGLLCLLAALLIQGILSILLGLLGAGCLWSIRELKEQAKRVERGCFKIPKENRTAAELGLSCGSLFLDSRGQFYIITIWLAPNLSISKCNA